MRLHHLSTDLATCSHTHGSARRVLLRRSETRPEQETRRGPPASQLIAGKAANVDAYSRGSRMFTPQWYCPALAPSGRRPSGRHHWCPSGVRADSDTLQNTNPPAPLKVRNGRRRPGLACIREGPKTKADAGSAALAMLAHSKCLEVMCGRLQRYCNSWARRHRSDMNLASELRSRWLGFIQY